MKTQQRGSGWSISLVFNLYKVFGYKFIYYLMYPVTFFYFIFATNVKNALKIYYKNIGFKFNNRIYYEHLRIFAICMVDRFISKVDAKSYTYSYDNITIPTQLLNSGAILLHSHFGGWAASSNSAHITNKINIVMQEVLLESIKQVENSLECKKKSINIIDLNQGALSVSIQIANALMKNEIVAIMGDRASSKQGEIKVDFFNKKASFNKAPFQLAYKTNTPILVYFIALVGMRQYEVKYIAIKLDTTREENEAINQAANKYIKKYEEILRKYPNQWFNFYNFWS